MKNIFIKYNNCVYLYIKNKKYGICKVIIDLEDLKEVSKFSWHVEKEKGCNYLMVRNNKKERLNKFILRVNGEIPNTIIRYKNGNRLDNRKKNLIYNRNCIKKGINDYKHFNEKIMYMKINSKKYGEHFVYFNTIDYNKIKKYRWYIEKSKSGTFYCKSNIDGKNVKLHRFILNVDKKYIIDHKDRNGLNNVRDNLRITNKKINNRNKKSSNKLSFNGVSFDKKRNRYIVFWVDDDSRYHRKTFSIKKYGNKALEKAIRFRFVTAIKYGYHFTDDERKMVKPLKVLIKRKQ